MKSKILFIVFFSSFVILNPVYSQWEQKGYLDGPCTSITSNGNNIFAGTYSLFRSVFFSTNNGANWQETTLNGISVNSILIAGSKIFVGTDVTPPYSFSADSSWGDGGVYYSTNNGTNWAFTGLYLKVVNCLAYDGNIIYAGTRYAGIYISSDNGGNWTQTPLNNVYLYEMITKSNKIFAGTRYNGIYVSSNSGTNWTQTSLNNKSVYALAENNNTLFAGLDSLGVYFSTDNGVNWMQTSLNNKDVNSIVTYNNNIFASVFSDGVYYSSNNGSTWVLINQGFTGTVNVKCLYIVNGYIFAGTAYSGMWRRPLSDIIGIEKICTEIPTAYSLSQNYPNPFNPGTIIKFHIKDSRFVTLKVFDILGKEVATLVNEKLQPGTYKVPFSINKFSNDQITSGVYFYKLTAGDYIATKKMMLIK